LYSYDKAHEPTSETRIARDSADSVRNGSFLLRLQRLAGNRAVAKLLASTHSPPIVQRQDDSDPGGAAVVRYRKAAGSSGPAADGGSSSEPSGADSPIDFGHVMVSVTDHARGYTAHLDYYPGPDGKSGVVNPNVDESRLSGFTDSVTMPVSGDQAGAMITRISNLASVQPSYHLIHSSCVTLTNSVLAAGGILLSGSAYTPTHLFELAKRYASAGAEPPWRAGPTDPNANSAEWSPAQEGAGHE
jgi:hypothetical protein